MMDRTPVAPRAFLMRLAWFELVLAAVQLHHLSVLTLAGPADFAAWAAVHGMAQLSLWVLRRSANQCRAFAGVPWQPLFVLLLLAGSVKLFSRMPYVTTWLVEGLQATRTLADEQLMDSGAASYINIFFYPLAILSAFAVMPRHVYRRILMIVILVSLVDLVFIGTRNAPAFVLLFHALLAPVRVRARHVAVMGTLLIGFVGLFSYSTVNRTADSVAGAFDWLVLFEFTKSAEVLQLDRAVVESLAEAAPPILPAVFLSHYLSHSVAELAHLVDRLHELQTGEAHHVVYQVCATRLCSQAAAFEGIERTNPRAGVYQTIWGSLILDFGLAGALLAWCLVIMLVAFVQQMRPRTLSLGAAIVSHVVMLGAIENYFFNGLGLLQVLCIFVAYRGLRVAGRRRRRPAPLARSTALVAT